MALLNKQNNAKAEIEKQAMHLIATKGYANTTVREIVEAAGVTKPTLYYYFQSKADLYEKIFKQQIDGFICEMEAIAHSDSSMVDRLERLADLHFNTLRADPLLTRFFFRTIFSGSSQMPQFDFNPVIDREDHCIQHILKCGVERGEIPKEAASFFSMIQFKAATHIYATRLAVGKQVEMPDDLAQKTVAYFLHGILDNSETEK